MLDLRGKYGVDEEMISIHAIYIPDCDDHPCGVQIG